MLKGGCFQHLVCLLLLCMVLAQSVLQAWIFTVLQIIFSPVLSLLVLLITVTAIHITAVGCFLGSGHMMTHWANKEPNLIWERLYLFPI